MTDRWEIAVTAEAEVIPGPDPDEQEEGVDAE